MVSGSVVAGIRNVLPVSLLTGNDLAGKQVFLYPKWFLSRSLRQDMTYLMRRLHKLLPPCAATRALAKKWPKNRTVMLIPRMILLICRRHLSIPVRILVLIRPRMDSNKVSVKSEETSRDTPASRSKLILAQENDSEISSLSGCVLPEDE